MSQETCARNGCERYPAKGFVCLAHWNEIRWQLRHQIICADDPSRVIEQAIKRLNPPEEPKP